ncbi:hypothetical protein D9613_003876 [Agrocybe pediades]|uniref:DUF6534 domain-containing protein n=1 Tax=Agrocybe pediades TaxID=84607 RepID=A0A8H4QI41_9AGAR|nr:hypothetical protein D9613_003876 [Agrocybe pediades]
MSFSADSLPPIPDDIAKLIGPPLIGAVLHLVLFGVLSTQVYLYFLVFPSDAMPIRLLVFGIYILEVTQSLFLIHDMFHIFASGFGNLLIFDQVGTRWFSVPVLTSIVAFVAQTFYAYRLRIIAQSKILASVILLLAFVQLCGGLVIAVQFKNAVLVTQFLGKKVYGTTGIWNGASAACDVLIAVAMTVYLKRRDTGVKQTTVLLRQIIRLTIETGLITAAVAILNLVLAVLPNQPNYYMASAIVLGKLYSNSTLALLNNRLKTRSGSHVVNSTLGNNISLRTDQNSSGIPRDSSWNVHEYDGRGHSRNEYEMSRGTVASAQEHVTFPPSGESWTAKDIQSVEDGIEDKPFRRL